MAIQDVLDAIKKSLENAQLVNSDDVLFYTNQFSFEELKRHLSQYPKFLISCSSFGDASETENVTGLSGYDLISSVRFSIFILVRNQNNNETNYPTSRILSEGVMMNLIDQDWGLDNCLTAYNRNAEPIFSTDNGQEETSIWSVSWSQTIGFNKEDVNSNIADWLRYQAEHYDQNNSEHVVTSSNVEIDQ